jgi:hypothetical protein
MFDSHTTRAIALGVAIGVALTRLPTGSREMTAGKSRLTNVAAPAGASIDPLLFTGNEWDKLNGDERDAYLQGFISGAAAQQAAAAKGSAEGKAVAARAVLLKRSGALTIPYRENVYRSHLDDWFFYTDRRPQTLIAVIVDASTGMRHHGGR